MLLKNGLAARFEDSGPYNHGPQMRIHKAMEDTVKVSLAEVAEAVVAEEAELCLNII